MARSSRTAGSSRSSASGGWASSARPGTPTSTFDEAKGTLVDVFDFEGRYLDSVYLQVNNGGSVASLSFVSKASNGKDLVLILRKGQELSVLKFALPSGASHLSAGSVIA